MTARCLTVALTLSLTFTAVTRAASPASATAPANAPSTAPATAPAPRATYTNPLPVRVADPFIFREGDLYYLYGTAAGDGVLVWTSRDLITWNRVGHAFRRDDASWGKRDFWAPELFKHQGKYYLHFTARNGDKTWKRAIILAEADSPRGPFKQTRAPWLEIDGGNVIDSHVFRDDDGKMYLYTVTIDRPPKQPTFEIFVRPLGDDLEPAPDRDATFCVRPSDRWEGNLVNEGPFVLRRGETYYLTWSANMYWDKTYSVGVATAPSPLGPWTKSKRPILAATEHVSGPGHHSFIDSPDGRAWFIAYHVHADRTNFRRGGRVLALDRVTFNDGADPPIVITGPTHTPQLLPLTVHR